MSQRPSTKPEAAPAAATPPPRPAAAAAAQPTGARPTSDGTDGAFRQTIDPRYTRVAALRASLLSVSDWQLSLGWAALAWSVALPWLLGAGGFTPLPPAAAVTSLLVGMRGVGAAEERTVKGLERHLGVVRSAVLLGVLDWGAPRFSAVPSGPTAAAVARWAARALGARESRARWWADSLDGLLSGAECLLFLLAWRHTRSLKLALEYRPQAKKD